MAKVLSYYLSTNKLGCVGSGNVRRWLLSPLKLAATIKLRG